MTAAASVLSTLFCIVLGFIWAAGVGAALPPRKQWPVTGAGLAFLGWMIWLSW